MHVTAIRRVAVSPMSRLFFERCSLTDGNLVSFVPLRSLDNREEPARSETLR